LEQLLLSSGTNPKLHSSCIVIVLSLVVSVSVTGIGLNSVQNVLAQQPQLQSNFTSVDGISFEIDNVTFSHHMAAVNGIQLHYVMGGEGDIWISAILV
jgi:hypothetical protein